jgi:hypothetical protein
MKWFIDFLLGCAGYVRATEAELPDGGSGKFTMKRNLDGTVIIAFEQTSGPNDGTQAEILLAGEAWRGFYEAVHEFGPS